MLADCQPLAASRTTSSNRRAFLFRKQLNAEIIVNSLNILYNRKYGFCFFYNCDSASSVVGARDTKQRFPTECFAHIFPFVCDCVCVSVSVRVTQKRCSHSATVAEMIVFWLLRRLFVVVAHYCAPASQPVWYFKDCVCHEQRAYGNGSVFSIAFSFIPMNCSVRAVDSRWLPFFFLSLLMQISYFRRRCNLFLHNSFYYVLARALCPAVQVNMFTRRQMIIVSHYYYCCDHLLYLNLCIYSWRKQQFDWLLVKQSAVKCLPGAVCWSRHLHTPNSRRWNEASLWRDDAK